MGRRADAADVTARRRVVLVVGPPLAGVGGVVVALRAHLPDVVVGEADSPVGRAPDAVVAVLSAATPLTRSDWAPIERDMASTDPVIAVVSKIDAHLGWRDVMAADRSLVAGWDPRHRTLPWVGVAAAPGLGEARIGELVEWLRARLTDPDLDERNRLRANRSRQAAPVRSAAESRRVLQHVRLQLLRFVRDQTTAWRGDLREVAAAVGVGGAKDFEELVTAEVAELHTRLTDEVTRAIDAATAELGMAPAPSPAAQAPPDVSRTVTSSRRLEGRLMAVLGIGFGLGIALASSRLLAGVAPGLSVAGWTVGAAAGVALVVWVVRARGLLHDRALLDRWVVEVAAALRWHGEAMVAERLLAAESQWSGAVARGPAIPPTDGPELTRAVVTDQYEWC